MSFKKRLSFITLSAILLIVVVLASCSSEKDPLDKYGVFVKTVMRNDHGAFRGFNFGEKMDSVTAKEAGPGAEADENYLYYEFKIDSLGSFDISYDFDENGLNEIHSDIFINDASQADSIFNSFKTYFDDHFGGSESHGGYTVWNVRSETFGDIKVNLSDESTDLTADHAPGKLSIWLYPDKE